MLCCKNAMSSGGSSGLIESDSGADTPASMTMYSVLFLALFCISWYAIFCTSTDLSFKRCVACNPVTYKHTQKQADALPFRVYQPQSAKRGYFESRSAAARGLLKVVLIEHLDSNGLNNTTRQPTNGRHSLHSAVAISLTRVKILSSRASQFARRVRLVDAKSTIFSIVCKLRARVTTVEGSSAAKF